MACCETRATRGRHKRNPDVKFFLNDLYLVGSKSYQTLSDLILYVLLGVLLSEALRYTSWLGVVQRACGARPLLAVILSSVIGAVSPLCTYGTVPVVAELVRSGVGVAPVVAFLSASSLMNPQLFTLTWGGISPGMATVRAGAVVLFAILLGLGISRVPSRWLVSSRLFEPASSS